MPSNSANRPPESPHPSPSTTQYGTLLRSSPSPLGVFYDKLPPSTPVLPPSTTTHNLRQPHTISGSTSLFAIPISSSSHSLRSTYFAPPQPGQIDWISLFVVYFVTLVAEAARGLLLPSTWPYYDSLGGSKATLGVFVACFSLGRMVSTIPLGYLSDNLPISSVLIVASLIQIIGHLIYAISPNLFILYFGRIVVGFGSATMSVCRAYLTRAVPSRIRTYHFAYLSALQFIGFAVLPAFGGLLANLPEAKPLPFVNLNGFTYPAYVLVFANFLAIFVIWEFFINPEVTQTRPSSRAPSAPPSAPSSRPPSRSPSGIITDTSNIPTQSPGRISSPSPIMVNVTNQSNLMSHHHHGDDDEEEEEEPQPDRYALIICLVVNVVFRGVIAEFETVSVPFLMEQYNVSYQVGSVFLSTVGLIGLAVYLSFKPISKHVSDRLLIVLGLFFILLGCLPLSVEWLSVHLPVSLYVICIGLTWSLAYPIGQTAVLGLFSKILAGLPAGGLLGIFSASGSIARLAMAILAGQFWNLFGRESVYIGIVAYAFAAVVVVLVSYDRLIPRDS